MAYFTAKTFAFLNDLADNNDREWFKANQDRYESEVREPALDFITDFKPYLDDISPHFRADARKVGGSLFRIQRDTRFAKDKTPYKTNTGVQFRHEAAADVHAPGFYLHLEPRNCFYGFGLWRPETKVAYTIRAYIDAEPDEWTKSIAALGDDMTLAGDSLKRPPRGYDPDHHLVEDLKRKDFIVTATLTQKEVTASGFMDDFADRCRTGSPFMAFLCQAVNIDY